MADAIRDAIPGAEVELVRGGRGDFIVTAGGRRVWDKKQVGRFPEPHEVLDQLA